MLVAWRRGSLDGGWLGRVAYAVDDADGQTVRISAWVPADFLEPLR